MANYGVIVRSALLGDERKLYATSATDTLLSSRCGPGPRGCARRIVLAQLGSR